MNVKETLTEVFQDVFDDDELELFDEMTADNEYISLISIGHVHSNNMCHFYNNRYYQLSSVSGYNASHPEDLTPSCTLTLIDVTKESTKEMYHFEKIEA